MSTPQSVDYPQLPTPTAPTPDWEADTDRLMADAQNLRSGPLLDQKLTEAQVTATAWTAAELVRIGDLMQEALDAIKERNR